MIHFFWLRNDEAVTSRYSGDFDAAHRWGLPGLKDCPGCGLTWSGSGRQYPAVNLSLIPEHWEFEEPRAEPFHELVRLRELVRPLVPPDASLPPGTSFGPLTGTASGQFGPFTWQGTSLMLIRRDALDGLQAAGIRGLLGCKTELRFRQKTPPDILELQIEPRGLLHRDCLPPDLAPPCPTCGHQYFRRPDDPILDGASLPTDRDLFRLDNFSTMIIGTGRFKDAVEQCGWTGISFRELPVRS
ncbi:hypothetical protein COCOR_00011 [Corallococcus coralloides DSM 2259]|uniref:Uncharacterized protein n=1 Tax=Corallococcus coralloides (strain ATCC 25202 / DSM 2259 / NBRC 100086 / M2) TaxID=1144275 RepID=H8MRX5_CORCM|nr:double-CXXCG motif protein [Corallococcus coralloides]AFE03210.1 hypothetical protein COCOR_00011 [Corallococcus coralloides DSM 2259]